MSIECQVSSVTLLTDLLKNNEDFIYTKLGDGEYLCMTQRVGANCDGQVYSEELAEDLLLTFEYLSDQPPSFSCFVGKWPEPNFKKAIETLVRENNWKFTFLSYRTLLNTNEEDIIPLKVNLFTEVANSSRRKVFIGPSRLNEVMGLLNCNQFIEVPLKNAYQKKNGILERISYDKKTIYIYSSGILSKPLIKEIHKRNPKSTHLDVGSGFDNLFVGNTRGETQMETSKLREFYSLLLK